MKDNHSPWPVQAYPLLISSRLSSEPATAPARPRAIWLEHYHIHTPSHTHTDTESFKLSSMLVVNTPFKNLCMDARWTLLYSNILKPTLDLQLVKKCLHWFEICRCEILYIMAEVEICKGARNRVVI